MGIIGRRKMATSLKVLICGDGAIGKTCLLDTICEKGTVDWDAPEYKPTAADNLQMTWCDADDKDWDVSLWDTAGQEALANLRKNAYPGTEILLIGFDMTKGVSLGNVTSWVDEVAESEENLGATILVGTKSDLYEELLASGKGSDGQPLKTIEEMYEMAAEINAAAFVCSSAMTGYGLLAEADGGPAFDNGCTPDTLSGQPDGENNFLDVQILRCGKLVKNGDTIATLESRKPAPPAPAPAPAKEEKAAPDKQAPAAPDKPKQAEPEKPKQAPAAPAKPAAKKEDGGCCTLL